MTDIKIQEEKFLLGILVDRAADKTIHGSFSERNPVLGRMKRCSFCGRRRREGSVCCSGKTFKPDAVGQFTSSDKQGYRINERGEWRKI